MKGPFAGQSLAEARHLTLKQANARYRGLR